MKKHVFSVFFAIACLLFCGCEENPIKDVIEDDNKEVVDDNNNEEIDDNNNEDKDDRYTRPEGIIERTFLRENPAPLQLTMLAQDSSFVEGNTAFASRLLIQAAERAGAGENVCLSPLSLQIGLGILGNGLSDKACREMLDVMVGKDVQLDDLNNWYHALRNAFEATHSVKLAGALWAQDGYPIDTTFIRKTRQYYDAEVGNLDFWRHGNMAKDSICQWAYDHTYGSIRELTLPLTSITTLVTTNIIWFGQSWANAFIPSVSDTVLFTHTDGSTQPVAMMHKTAKYDHADCGTYQLVSIPFDLHDFSMMIALPKSGTSIADVMNTVNWSTKLRTKTVELSLPRFRLTSKNELKPILKSLGIEKALTETLPRIHKDLVVEFVNQDIALVVNEDGIEAAATTSVSHYIRGPVNFNVNHPFLFAIRDNKAGNLLFLGKMETIETTEAGKGIQKE